MSATERRMLRTPPSRHHESPIYSAHDTPDKVNTPKKEHQRFVLTDPIAARYLSDDPSTTVLERGSKLTGYECYIVEQWAVSRTDPTFMITTYTGDPKHVVMADVLSVPSDEKTWSPILRVFFKELNQYHARREMTPLGTLMVTNLSGFPSYLTVIPVPDGNLTDHRSHFYVNLNLKRLGCLGRLGLALGPAPSSATMKFQQIYHTSEKNDVQESIVQLVRLCQLALYLFDKLDIEFTDGLLCDMTERAISRWWNDIGTEQYGVEPHDGPLGPTTVAALLGLLMGSRNRLRSFGIAVPKDAFDLEDMKRGISQFQKQQHMSKTRKLDRATLKLLHKATAKAAAGEGWAVPKAVKSTVAELSGRGGEMLNDAVRKRDRAGIAEIETTEYDHFVELVYGAHAKWLWRGKPLKSTNAIGISRHRHTKSGQAHEQQERDADSPKTPVGESDGSDIDERSGLRKRATDLRNEAKSGLGKLKDAVHLRNRQQASPKQDHGQSPQSMPRTSVDEAPKSDYSSPASPFSGPTSPTSPALERMPDFFSLSDTTAAVGTAGEHSGTDRSRDPSPGRKAVPKLVVPSGVKDFANNSTMTAAQEKRNTAGITELDMNLALPEGMEGESDVGTALRRTISDSQGFVVKSPIERPSLYPKHLSFTLAEDTILPWTSIEPDSSADSALDDDAVYAAEAYRAERSRHLREAIKDLHDDTSTWTEQQIAALQKLVDQTGVDQRAAEESYQPRAEAMQALTSSIDVLLRDERERLEEGTKEIETLAARLNYEIQELKGRIEDVDQVVDDFESAVHRVEDRVAELEKDDGKRRGLNCMVM